MTVARRQLEAVRWIMAGAAMKPPVKRTQMAAAAKFDISQAMVSLGMKKYIKLRGGKVPDGRVGWPRPDLHARGILNPRTHGKSDVAIRHKGWIKPR